ncbi:hypothetical protein FACS18942_01540 [Planctomycetales bacterium]|nr:hypothetical protein FACS18942_01540 [Planctomycetales bacterium]
MPETGGVLVVCNHQSYFDPPLLGGGLRRQLNYLARKPLFDSPAFSWLIRMLDAIPLDVNGIGFDGIKESLKRLRGGEALLIFPEGARTFDGQIAEFKEGALTLAQRSRAAILPTALDGCFQAWNRKNKLPYPWGKIRVIFGKPLFYEEFKDLSEEELRRLIENKIKELFEELKKEKR